MSDMPERIWALECMDGRIWNEPADSFDLYTEYVRADKYAELEEQLDGLVSWFRGHGFSAQEVRKWVDEQRGD